MPERVLDCNNSIKVPHWISTLSHFQVDNGAGGVFVKYPGTDDLTRRAQIATNWESDIPSLNSSLPIMSDLCASMK